MPFNSNFTGVTLGTDPATGANMLFVEGQTEPAGAVTDIFVALSFNGGELRSGSADHPELTGWRATFPDATPPFAGGGEAFVVGVAMRPPPHDPLVWQGSFEIQARTNV
jgi:hypothetical protein